MVLCIDTENGAKILSIISPFITIIVTIVLFFANRKLERKHEKFKKFFDKKIEIIEEAINLVYILCEDNPLDKKGFKEDLNKLKLKIQIYFSLEESKVFEKMIDESLAKNNNLKSFQAQRDFIKLFGDKLRSEFGLSKRFKR